MQQSLGRDLRASRRPLGNETRSSRGGFGEVPNCWQRNHSSKKANYKNVQRVGVGVVGHSILHHHEENVGELSDFLCGISHTIKLTVPRQGHRLIKRRPGAYRLGDCPGTGTEPNQPGRCPLFVLASLESKAR